MQKVEPYAGWLPHSSWAVVDANLAVLIGKTEYWNLAWLLFPVLDFLAKPHDDQEVDVSWLEPIVNHMDVFTLEYLRHPPDQFMDYWLSVDTGELAMTEHLPEYLQVMKRRAEEAMRRMYPPVAENVVRVDFKAKRRVCP